MIYPPNLSLTVALGVVLLQEEGGNLAILEILLSDFFCWIERDCTKVSFVYRSVHALSENKLATTQTDEKLLVME